LLGWKVRLPLLTVGLQASHYTTGLLRSSCCLLIASTEQAKCTPKAPGANGRHSEGTHPAPTSSNRGYQVRSFGAASHRWRYWPGPKSCGRRPRLLACPFCCGEGEPGYGGPKSLAPER
jgi:hypothetical protein